MKEEESEGGDVEINGEH